MEKHLEAMHALTAKNAALLQSAQRASDSIADASHTEIDRLGQELAKTVPGDAITDPLAGARYLRNVMHRGSLMRQVAGTEVGAQKVVTPLS